MKEIIGGYREGMRFADLHIHTTGSDGKLTPQQVVDLAIRDGRLNAIAITDHNAIASSFEALDYAAKIGSKIEVIPGTEISTADGHIVGLYLKDQIDFRKPADWTVAQIHRQGGLAIIPHPFYNSRSLGAEQIRSIINHPDPEIFIDGFEVFNAGVSLRTNSTNGEALAFYNQHGDSSGAPIGASDGHLFVLGKALIGYEGDLREAIRKRQTTVFILDQEEVHALLKLSEEMFGEMVTQQTGRFERRFKRAHHPI